WCPLGPRGVVYAEPHYWLFVRSHRFLEPVRRVALPYTHVRVWYARARPMPIYRPGARRGPPTHVIEVATHPPIHAVPIVEPHRAGGVGRSDARRAGATRRARASGDACAPGREGAGAPGDARRAARAASRGARSTRGARASRARSARSRALRVARRRGPSPGRH